MEENELQELLIDTQKEYTRSNKFKDKMIVLLIVLMFLEAAIGYCGLFGMKANSIMLQPNKQQKQNL
ncbi:MAG: hypothetical protein ACLS3T_04335 [Anaerobutyricum sp.]